MSDKFETPLWVSASTLLLCAGMDVPNASSYVLGISEDLVLELLTVPLMGFSLSGGLSEVPNGTWVDFLDPLPARDAHVFKHQGIILEVNMK